MQRDIEQEVDVVQQCDGTCSLGNDPPEKRWNLDTTLPLGQVEQTAGELETDVDARRVDSFGDISQSGGFSRALRTPRRERADGRGSPRVRFSRPLPRRDASSCVLSLGIRAICTAAHQPMIEGLFSEPPAPPDLLA